MELVNRTIPQKKTAIRMPLYLWEELTEIAERLGVSCNSLMVVWVGERIQQEKMKMTAMTPDGIGKILSQLTGEQLTMLGNPLPSETVADAVKEQKKR